MTVTDKIRRRSLIAGLAATGAAAMLSPPAAALSRMRPFFERIGRPIGLQTYTLGDEAGRDLDRTFAEVAAIGYRDIEIPGLYGKTPAEVGAAASRAGLAISSIHLAVSTMGRGAGLTIDSPPEALAEGLGQLGATHAVLPIMLFPAGMRPLPNEGFPAMIARTMAAAGEDPWKRTAEVLNRAGAALKPHGISVGYHNHNLEFAPVGKSTGWDILVAECERELVHFEVDIGWVATAGRDPLAFFRAMRGRVRQLHVKDVAAGNTANFAISMQPAEVGSGTLDWARLLPAARRAGVRHFYVEQEPPFAIARIEAARKAYALLSQMRA